ncbi:MAG: hypothetical protein ACTSU6_01750 [Candidatus Njordarchaeales archaeon]|jgi:hypothetical protein
MIKTLNEISLNTPITNPFELVQEKGEPTTPILYPGHMYALGVIPNRPVSPADLPLTAAIFEQHERYYEHNLPYYDTLPIGIALNMPVKTGYVSFLNLKVPSPVHRNVILGTYFKAMGIDNKLITKYYNEDLTESDMPFIERLKESTYINPFMVVTKKFMNEILGANISFAVSLYEINSIKSVKFLDWNALPGLFKMGVMDNGMIFNESVNGLAGIHERFESYLQVKIK